MDEARVADVRRTGLGSMDVVLALVTATSPQAMARH